MSKRRRELTDDIADMADRAAEAASSPEDRETMYMDGSPDRPVGGGIRASLYWMNAAIQGLISRVNDTKMTIQAMAARSRAQQQAELVTRRVAALALALAVLALAASLSHWWAR